MRQIKDLSLSGSQMNLHERPSPRNTTPRTKRPTSAVPAPGYEGPTRPRGGYDRPQSADETRTNTGRHSGFTTARKVLNSNTFDSDLDLTCLTPTLSPTLLTPPSNKNPPTRQLPQDLHQPIEEDLVDLKFRNWFPNSSCYPYDAKYSDEILPAFVPDSRTSTNDIPTSCRAGTSSDHSCLTTHRMAKSDNALHRIGSKSEGYGTQIDETYGTEVGETQVGETCETESKVVKKKGNSTFTQSSDKGEGRSKGHLRKSIQENCRNGQEENDGTLCSRHINTYRQDHGCYTNNVQQIDEVKLLSDNEEHTQENGHNRQNSSEHTHRYNLNQAYNVHSNTTSTLSGQRRSYEYYKTQQAGSEMFTSQQSYYYNDQNQRDSPAKEYYSGGIETIQEDIGATSNEYYIQHEEEKNNKDGHHEGRPHRISSNEMAKEGMNKCDDNDKEYQEYWRNLVETGHDSNLDLEVYKQKNRCDSCSRNKYENLETHYHYDNNRSIKNHTSEVKFEAVASENPDGFHKGFSRNITDVVNETDSARSEKSYHNKSMEVLNKIYENRKKERQKHGKSKIKKLKSFDDTASEQRNGIVSKNDRRKSLGSLKTPLSKSLSEDMFARANGIRLNHMNFPYDDQKEQIKVNYVNNSPSTQPIQEVSLYLEQYDFEQDERILNHILESKEKSIPEIQETDAFKVESPVKDMNSTTYNEIVDILKVLEREENPLPASQSSQASGIAQTEMDLINREEKRHNNYKIEIQGNLISNRQMSANIDSKIDRVIQSQVREANQSNENDTEIIQITDIYSFLDQVDNQASLGHNASSGGQVGSKSKLSELMKLNSADLAQKYLTLSIDMDEKQIIISALEKRMEQIDKHCKEMKTDSDATVKRLQKFIAQLIKEKKDLSEQCADMCKDMDKKYKQIIETMEERHKIEIRKNTDKHLAAEKIRREKWIDNKTQKIKELTVKGLEPELLKMTTTHQEEISELRKAHNRQIEENDGMWNRKITSMKEKFEGDLQNSILHERENNRKRMDEEIKTIENNYQQQRQHLLNEIRIERENLDRQAEDMRNEKEKELNQKLEKMANQNKETCERLERKYQEDIRKLKEELHKEKQLWIETKKAQNEEKEQLIREQCKRERDKHIELIIQKLEKEQTDRNNATDAKLKTMKEQHERDVADLEAAVDHIKSKLNETRVKLENSEDQATELKTQVHSLQVENKSQGELLVKMGTENHNLKLKSEHETSDKVKRLEDEIEQTRRYFETLVDRMKKDQERELSQVYGRVKETIGKKDEAIRLLTQQKQAALTQCASLESILAQRKH